MQRIAVAAEAVEQGLIRPGLVGHFEIRGPLWRNVRLAGRALVAAETTFANNEDG